MCYPGDAQRWHPQQYGANYIRIGIPDLLFNDICSKALEKLGFINPPIEKAVKKNGLYVFTHNSQGHEGTYCSNRRWCRDCI